MTYQLKFLLAVLVLFSALAGAFLIMSFIVSDVTKARPDPKFPNILDTMPDLKPRLAALDWTR